MRRTGSGAFTAYAGRMIRLFCDNGIFHHTRAVTEWLKTNRHLYRNILVASVLSEFESYRTAVRAH